MAELARVGDLDRHLLQGAGPCPLDLPRRPMRAAAIEGGDALWLGPEEWLLLLAPGTALDPAIGTAGSLVDVSHRTLGFRLAGRDAAPLLNGGVPLDLGLPAFPVGCLHAHDLREGGDRALAARRGAVARRGRALLRALFPRAARRHRDGGRDSAGDRPVAPQRG